MCNDNDATIDDERDSSLGLEVASSSESLRSSIVQYRQENGRTYHRYKDGKYNLPNDDIECERLDLQHNLFIVTLGNKLGLAPPNDPDSKVKRVLDVGTGTGIWAIDFGDEHPEARVIGVDLSPIQPSFVPPNVEFFIDDIEEPWSFSEPFDYVHSRMMTFSIKSWPDYVKNIYANLAPGGYVELLEIDLFAKSDDNTLKDDSPLSKCIKLLDEASTKIGRPFQDNTKNKNLLKEAGFVDIVETTFKWPTGPWPKDKHYKELGAWNNTNMDALQGLEALAMAGFTRVLGWSQEEVTVFLASVRKDLRNKSIHAYWPVYSTYGRRPVEKTEEDPAGN
ncbi:S-adenosyl-L-methionine-dependent methyltransferase [Dactylonectria macrodidyma]|uniref:S-adenosyl-L-methionine-dependent methyltransferase n=1 Tax=Dactylonectria macrodidyma TaxID=307937 RepID=A0A9P9FAA4_9HYPO|nr:S-adenosyl-L-methionine-dependent methyltransferase [Dactylonectria macrodidyma]